VTTHQATILLFDLALILVVTRTFGAVATRLGQPAVIGEILGGILLGPTLFDGALAHTLFPADVRPFLSALANLGVALFMFVVGMELDQRLIKGKLRIAISVSAGSILLPLGLGTALAFYLYNHHGTGDRAGFILFMGVAMSITAFPVLARILTDRDLHRTAIGGIALASAAMGDALAWSLLAMVIAMVSGAVQWQLILAIPYLVLMFTLVRPLLGRLANAHDTNGKLSRTSFAIVLIGVLTSGALTEWFGLHFIFGAFLFGTIMPRSSLLREDILGPIEQLSLTLLLPVYFVVAGLQVNLSSLGPTGLIDLTLILLVAITGKFAGAFTAARLHHLPTRSAAILGTLMNTRGLTELVVLTIGLHLGLLDTRLYSLMVLMALVTTAMAGPLLHFLHPNHPEDLTHLPPNKPSPKQKNTTHP
jgi:Kef-type K+ transport system membrane component KefB